MIEEKVATRSIRRNAQEETVRTNPYNTLRFYEKRCINCGMCLAVCPHAVFGEGQQIVALLHPVDCIECGACQKNCPTGAVRVESGVGCAAAMINAALSGSSEVTCGCDSDSCC